MKLVARLVFTVSLNIEHRTTKVGEISTVRRLFNKNLMKKDRTKSFGKKFQSSRLWQTQSWMGKNFSYSCQNCEEKKYVESSKRTSLRLSFVFLSKITPIYIIGNFSLTQLLSTRCHTVVGWRLNLQEWTNHHRIGRALNGPSVWRYIKETTTSCKQFEETFGLPSACSTEPADDWLFSAWLARVFSSWLWRRTDTR